MQLSDLEVTSPHIETYIQNNLVRVSVRGAAVPASPRLLIEVVELNNYKLTITSINYKSSTYTRLGYFMTKDLWL